jgi:hypothetical protein
MSDEEASQESRIVDVLRSLVPEEHIIAVLSSPGLCMNAIGLAVCSNP